MTAPSDDYNRPFAVDSVIEIPITCFEDYPRHIRPLQVCAISTQELKHALRVADRRGDPVVNIVSHSFELLNRARTGPNPLLLRRFNAFCDLLQQRSRPLTFADLRPEPLLAPPRASAPPPSPTTGTLVRTAARMVEQVAGRLFFDRRPYSMPVMSAP
jgi:hypothetical protein